MFAVWALGSMDAPPGKKWVQIEPHEGVFLKAHIRFHLDNEDYLSGTYDLALEYADRVLAATTLDAAQEVALEFGGRYLQLGDDLRARTTLKVEGDKKEMDN